MDELEEEYPFEVLIGRYVGVGSGGRYRVADGPVIPFEYEPVSRYDLGLMEDVASKNRLELVR